mmetsp:Transcript_14933/g.36080  ORF Transcript_14933/g.36080 Transcript_14933/m.36080 type:complete len:203 (+) Transcript_14933:2678-3286(+)
MLGKRRLRSGGPRVGRRDVKDAADELENRLRPVGVGFEVAHRNYRHAARMVPALVETPHRFWCALLDHIHLSDRKAVSVEGPLHERRDIVLIRPPRRRAALAPLFHHDSALGLDVLVGAPDEHPPLSQDRERLLKSALRVDGEVYEVDGLVEGRIRVLAGPELRSDALKKAHDFEVCVHCRATKGEVLHYVRHPLLLLRLKD